MALSVISVNSVYTKGVRRPNGTRRTSSYVAIFVYYVRNRMSF